MAVRRWLLCALLLGASPASAQPAGEPSVRGGLGKVVGGVLLEFPKTVLEATMIGPPVVGTAIGLLAGVSRASQMIVKGALEAASAFDPWGRRPTR